ncbi:hypothetical protein GIB67_042548 [Kingdonia uniflora]|uniref:Aminotransferase-like plant mobile domain-containing protein n=1 Tax=Kingdonia uniflora TaxID=39325 RepID=A0A7J7M132_9MAGN|nr:hypothetical protein GIB67_042548 [Kingdonia uniflora]
MVSALLFPIVRHVGRVSPCPLGSSALYGSFVGCPWRLCSSLGETDAVGCYDRSIKTNKRSHKYMEDVIAYDMVRLKRIEENNANMDALGLRRIATGMSLSHQKKSKPNGRKNGNKKVVYNLAYTLVLLRVPRLAIRLIRMEEDMQNHGASGIMEKSRSWSGMKISNHLDLMNPSDISSSVGENYECSSGRNCEGKAAANNEEVGLIDTSLLRSFKFHRARSIALGQVFEKNLLLYLKGFKAMKDGGASNSLSLKKLREHYTYKLDKVLSDGTATRAKKKGLIGRFVARAYMLYVLGSFLFPTKKGIDVIARYMDGLAKDKAAKKWSWGSAVLAHIYHNLGTASRDDWRQFACCTTLLEVVWDPYRDKRDFAHGFKEIAYFYGTQASPDHIRPYYPNWVVRQFSREQGILTKPLCLDVSKLWISEEPRKYNPKYEWVDCFTKKKWKDWILKKPDRERRVQEGPPILENKNLQEKNASLEAELRQKFDLKECNLAILQLHQHMTDINLAKKYDNLLSAHEELKKKLIAKEDFILNWTSKYKKEAARVTEETNNLCKKLVNAEEMKKSLEVNNNEWVWRQSFKKALASEGMGDMWD